MFEDSTFESMGKIHTRSRGWMIATFTFNGSILLALIVIPLIYPSALPRMANAIPMLAPQEEKPKPVVKPEHTPPAQAQLPGRAFQAPSRIPRDPRIPSTPEPLASIDATVLGDPANNPDGLSSAISAHSVHPDVRPAIPSTTRVSKGVMEGMLVQKVLPVYPAMGRAVRVQGTVVLQAIISRTGTIENLRVVSGPALLQQAALDAVKQWRYRPYLLNGEPVEVETTINVDFKMD
jgi:periplasmic protein TonB